MDPVDRLFLCVLLLTPLGWCGYVVRHPCVRSHQDVVQACTHPRAKAQLCHEWTEAPGPEVCDERGTRRLNVAVTVEVGP